ncbi:hypothetical protein, partial [Treponema pedis]|uniref:hypothetical protein n=1 Tax=Treponema pedis TaxID=409322 RepID=UPI00056DAF6A
MFNCKKFTTIIDKEIYELSNGKYELSDDLVIDRYYFSNDSYFEMPLLPSGLFLYYRDDNGLFYGKDSMLYPVLDYQKRIEDINFYPKTNIICIEIYSDKIRIETAENKVFDILLDDPWCYTDVTDINRSNDGRILKSFKFLNRNIAYKSKLVTSVFSLQDNKKNKYFLTNYSTPIISGITKIGICSYDSKKFYIGETIYSYFTFDIETGNVHYFKNKQKYNEFCYNSTSYSGIPMLNS